MSLLEVKNLGVRFQTQDALIYAVNGINFSQIGRASCRERVCYPV